VVALGFKRLETRNNIVRFVVQIGDQDDQTAPGQIFREKPKRLSEFRLLAGLNSFDFGQDRQKLSAPAARRYMSPDVRIEGKESDTVALMVREIRQARRQNSGVVDLLDVG